MNEQSNQPDIEPCEDHVVDHDVPPDGGYGWICVLCCFLINAHTWGINSSYGEFLGFSLFLSTDFGDLIYRFEVKSPFCSLHESIVKV